MMKKYDIIILGAGPGGYVAAIKAAQLGAKVALVEKQDIGGVCLNWGCIPTKALLKSTKVYKMILNSLDYGIIVDKSSIKFDWSKIVGRKDSIVKRLTGGVKTLLDKNGVEVYKGYGSLSENKVVEVNGEKIQANAIIIATGASPIIPLIPGVKEAYEKGIILTSKEILSLNEVPKRLTIIGGGVIGFEFATIFSTFGTEITILERQEKVLLNVDDEVRDAYLKIIKQSKVNIITSANVTKVDNNQVTYHFNGNDVTINSDKILMSVGMKPNVDSFKNINLEMTKQGITVNEQMETSIKGIYAIGDVNGKIMLAHVASAEGIVAVENILGKASIMDYNKVPACIYGLPEIAMVGLTEAEAKSQGLSFKVSKFPLAANGKALAEGESEGFIKIISDTTYGEIIGMHILASNATDLISEGVTTMELEGTVYELAKSIHPHPTLSEIVMEAAHGAIDKPIHFIK
jgi:dihydrolipoamide dehydrogenase